MGRTIIEQRVTLIARQSRAKSPSTFGILPHEKAEIQYY